MFLAISFLLTVSVTETIDYTSTSRRLNFFAACRRLSSDGNCIKLTAMVLNMLCTRVRKEIKYSHRTCLHNEKKCSFNLFGSLLAVLLKSTRPRTAIISRLFYNKSNSMTIEKKRKQIL